MVCHVVSVQRNLCSLRFVRSTQIYIALQYVGRLSQGSRQTAPLRVRQLQAVVMAAGRLLRQAILQQIRIAGTQSRTTIGAPGHLLQVCTVDSQTDDLLSICLIDTRYHIPQADLISLHTRQFCGAQALHSPCSQQLKSAWPQNQVPSQLQHLRYGNLPTLP